MNKMRRKKIEVIVENLRSLVGEIEEVKDEEEAYKDEMPENLQNSEKAYAAEEAVSNLESAWDYVEDAIAYLESAAE